MVDPVDLLEKYKAILRAKQLELAERLLKLKADQIDLDNAIRNAGNFAELQAGVEAADAALLELEAAD